MKLFLSSILLALVGVASSAFAVSVSQCPQTLKVSYEALQTFSDNILTKIPGRSGLTPDEYDMKELTKIRDAVAAAPASTYSGVEYQLVSTKNSQCNYASPLSRQDDPGSLTRLFTRDGRDILRVAINVDTETTVWVYYTVASYSTRGVKIEVSKPTAGIMGLFDHGSPSFYVGNAVEPTIK